MFNIQLSRIPYLASRIPYLAILFFIFSSCSVTKQISKSAKTEVLNNKALLTAHVGISIFESAANKYWFNYQGDKYFIPASNTKIPTCYAAMKYLGDSLVGLKYGFSEAKDSINMLLCIQPTGDPTFLNREFNTQLAYTFLKNQRGKVAALGILDTVWKDEAFGSGWSWNDFNEPYMTERSALPIYGNLIKFIQKEEIQDFSNQPALSVFTEPEISWPVNFNISITDKRFLVKRLKDSNHFEVTQGLEKYKEQDIPFITYGNRSAFELLTDTLHMAYVGLSNPQNTPDGYQYNTQSDHIRSNALVKKWTPLYSQPTDSLLKPMMHRSDNFFAEQSLLMVSNQRLGFMSDARIIDTLLKTDFSDLPQKPRWADGSGLSRYNLFTPQDFVAILNKMNKEFGMERLKVILPTGGKGTISSYYKADSGYIYGKTGTLSGVVAFSGFMWTKKGKLLIFSTLINNHQASATDVRRAIEKFLQGIRNKY